MDGIVDVIECEKDRYLERGDVASSIIKMDRLCTDLSYLHVGERHRHKEHNSDDDKNIETLLLCCYKRLPVALCISGPAPDVWL
jgi:hypothetical protein